MVRFTRKSLIVQLIVVLVVLVCLHLYLSDYSTSTQVLDTNDFPMEQLSPADRFPIKDQGNVRYSTDSYKTTKSVDVTNDVPTTPSDTADRTGPLNDSQEPAEPVTDEAESEYYHNLHQDDDDPNKTEFDLEYRMKKAAIGEVITKRMERVKDVCKRLNYPNSNQYNTYNFGKFGVTWCPTFKASSSTWRDFFIDKVRGTSANFMGVHYHLGVLGNQVLPRSMISHATSAKGRKRVFRGEPDSNVRFTVVRHPFSRIISHQRKAMNTPYEIGAQRGDWIEASVMDGRTDAKWSSTTKDKYKREYDTYVKEIKRNPNGRHASYSDDNPYLHPTYPTVPELVDFIMKHRGHDDKGLNGHWRPTIEWCDICQNDLDIIIQLEEEPMELLYLLDRMNMWEHRKHFLGRHNSSGNKSAGQEEIAFHKAQLTQGQIDYLNQMYAADLEMFGYDPI